MTENPLNEPKAALHRYLTVVRESVLWKLDGLSEYDLRRPMTPTGTNLLGVVKHLASVTIGYFGPCFGREVDVGMDYMAWYAPDAEPNADMFATEHETREQILDLYRQAGEITDATVTALALDAEGHVPWWGDRNPVTLAAILVHMVAETNRHAGQMDIVRELIDGSAGWRADVSNMPDDVNWPEYHDRLEKLAAQFR